MFFIYSVQKYLKRYFYFLKKTIEVTGVEESSSLIITGLCFLFLLGLKNRISITIESFSSVSSPYMSMQCKWQQRSSLGMILLYPALFIQLVTTNYPNNTFRADYILSMPESFLRVAGQGNQRWDVVGLHSL